jgi:hypothetical protein
VTSARVTSSIGCDDGDLLIRWDLFQKTGQHRGIADVACGDPDRADLQCFFVHAEMELAPHAFFAPTMFARVPLAVILSLDLGCISQKM